MLEADDAPQDELETLAPIEAETPAPEPDAAGADEDPPEAEPEDDDELEISFGDEAPAARGTDSDLVRHMRAEIRRRDEELANFRSGKIQIPQPQAIEVGPKPTMESCDYDEDKFEAELDGWKARKRQAEEGEATANQKAKQIQDRFATKLNAFAAGKTSMKVRDFELSETAVLTSLNQVQQALLIQAADDSARLVYALGRHPEKLKSLAGLDDAMEFTKALVKLEGQLKVTSRKAPPEPDLQPRGAAPIAAKTDKELERLEKAAERTGDRTAVIAYKRRQKAQGK